MKGAVCVCPRSVGSGLDGAGDHAVRRIWKLRRHRRYFAARRVRTRSSLRETHLQSTLSEPLKAQLKLLHVHTKRPWITSTHGHVSAAAQGRSSACVSAKFPKEIRPSTSLQPSTS